MIGLESLFGSLQAVLGKDELQSIIQMLTINNRQIFDLPIPQIKEGEKACLTLFNPSAAYMFDETMIKSKSKNSGFIGQQLLGKVVGIINNNKIELN